MIAPPRTAELLLESLGAEPGLRDAMLGDLAEEFAERAARDGVSAARRWYWGESLRASPHLLRAWSRGAGRRDIGRLLGVALTSYVFLLIVLAAASITLEVVLRAFDAPVSTQELSFDGPLGVAARLVGGLVGAASGGYIAASLDERAPLVAALALGLTWSAATVVVSMLVGVPAWNLVAAPIVLAGTLVGGLLRARARAVPSPT